MREVDEALARAYSQREKGEPGRGVPPAPHWPARPASQEPAPFPGAEDAPASARGSEPSAAGPISELQWPAVVLGLERDWGDRFERLAGQLVEIRRRQNIRAILFTSCHRAEGRTTLVLTLARALARHPGRFLLVDADLTGPMLARQLGLRLETGIDDVIEGGRPLGEALYEAVDDHLTVLPLRA